MFNRAAPKGLAVSTPDYNLRGQDFERLVLSCEAAGLSDLKFHDLRKTFGSILAQNGVSTAVTQRLLEHASPRLTNKVYTNVDPVLRHAVEKLPVGDWL